MFKSIEGIYRNGKIELTQLPTDVRDETHVIVTFLEPAPLIYGRAGLTKRARQICALAWQPSPRIGTAQRWISTTIADSEIDRVIGKLPMTEVDAALRHTLGL